MSVSLIESKWLRTIQPESKIQYKHSKECNALTFAGVCDIYRDEIAPYAKKSVTLEQYDQYFNIICSHLPDHNRKLINEYIKNDFDICINSIVSDGQKRSSELCYSDSSIKKIKRLISVVISVAAAHGFCINCFEDNKDKQNQKINVKRIKKSFSPEEEIVICKKLFADPFAEGQSVGQLLQWSLGLRNNEACGANYGHIVELPNYPDINILCVVQSSKIGSSELKQGGKTPNSYRMIVIPDKVYDFLMVRKNRINELFPESDISTLPIANRGLIDRNHIERRCSSADLTKAGMEFFNEIHFSEESLNSIFLMLKKSFREGNELYEQSATEYTYRRNYCTHLELMDIDNPAVYFLMGHSLLNTDETRNSFADEDKLAKLAKILSTRPLVNYDKNWINIDDFYQEYYKKLL